MENYLAAFVSEYYSPALRFDDFIISHCRVAIEGAKRAKAVQQQSQQPQASKKIRKLGVTEQVDRMKHVHGLFGFPFFVSQNNHIQGRLFEPVAKEFLKPN